MKLTHSWMKCNKQILTFFFLFSVFLNFSVAEELVLPQQVWELHQAAEGCLQARDYSGAQTKYQQILMDYPDVIWAQSGLIQSLIYQRDFSTAKTETTKLLSDFSSDPEIAFTIRKVADHYRWSQRYAEGYQLYQNLATNWPDSPEMIWCQRGLACCAVAQNEILVAEAAISRLLSDFSTHPNIANAIREVADSYYYAKDLYKARDLYTWVSQKQPEGKEAIQALRGLAMTNLRLVDYAAADTALETLLTTYSDHTEIAYAIKEIANTYLFYANDPVKARALYKKILQDWPDSLESMQAQCGLVLTAIELGQTAAADAAVIKLLSEYADYPRMDIAIREIADWYFYTGNDPAKASALYQYFLLKWPDSCEVLKAQRGLAMAKVRLGEDVAAESVTENLLADFTDDPHLSDSTAEVIHEYCRARKSGEVMALAEKILAGNPESAMALTAHTGLAQAHVQLDQPQKAQEEINLLLSDYKDQPQLGYSLFVIGQEYFTQGKNYIRQDNRAKAQAAFTSAITMWDEIPAHTSDRKHQAMATYYSAQASAYLDDYAAALAYYQLTAHDYPEYERAWHAHYMAAECAMKLAAANQIDNAVAENLKSYAYENILQKYPNCPVAERIRQQ